MGKINPEDEFMVGLYFVHQTILDNGELGVDWMDIAELLRNARRWSAAWKDRAKFYSHVSNWVMVNLERKTDDYAILLRVAKAADEWMRGGTANLLGIRNALDEARKADLIQ
jgi:hypothetical protein